MCGMHPRDIAAVITLRNSKYREIEHNPLLRLVAFLFECICSSLADLYHTASMLILTDEIGREEPAPLSKWVNN